MPGAWTLLAAIALLRMQAVPEVVVTTGPSMDAQRLADALRVYLDEYGIRVQTRVAVDAVDLQARLDDARALGAAVRAVAVVRADHGAPGSVEIDLVDLATGKALVVSVPRPQRDEDLYRALALKIQAVLRATLSEARADLDSRVVAGTPRRERRRTDAGATGTNRFAPRPRRRVRRRLVPERRAALRRARGPGVLAAAAAGRARAGNRGARVGQRVERHGRRDGDDRPGARVRQDFVRRRKG